MAASKLLSHSKFTIGIWPFDFGEPPSAIGFAVKGGPFAAMQLWRGKKIKKIVSAKRGLEWLEVERNKRRDWKGLRSAPDAKNTEKAAAK